ncbi:prepilin peptidase [Ectobacillus panaciterrae]|uniref:prepilin peptidase n=1 Tax=Ectobacillus panaciterrae TaxID=363872 RepID=UPI00040CD615|nr:A24 family peptidase [Ectobacillus panaciterrae]
MLGLYIYIFIVGLVLGSFYNVVGMRVPAGQSIVRPRSACPSCSHTLTARELVPVLSYVWQGGKCRNCRTRISPVYPVFELLTGLLFAFTFYWLGWDAEVFIGWTLVSLLMIIVVSDLSYMLIPNKILLFFMIVFVIERICVPLHPWWESIMGAAIGFILLFLIAVLSKGGMGGGDVKLFGVLGFVLGGKLVILAFLLSCFFGTIFGLAGLATGHVKRGKPMPFGPFIMLGALTSYFFGHRLIQYYISFF